MNEVLAPQAERVLRLVTAHPQKAVRALYVAKTLSMTPEGARRLLGKLVARGDLECVNADGGFYEWRVRPSLAKRCRHRRARRRLTNVEAQQMRSRYAAGGVTQQTLAAEYGVSRGNVSKIVNGVTYV